MNFKKYILAILVFSIFSLNAKDKTDSLENLIKNKDLSNIERIDVLHKLLIEYQNILPEKGIDYAKEALKLIPPDTLKAKEFQLFIGIGDAYRFTSQYELAIEYYFKALRSAEKQKSSLKRARAFNNIGLVYNNIRDYDLALDYIKRSTKLFETIKDTIFLVQAYNNLASIYWNKNENDNAMKYFNLAFEISKKMNDLIGLLQSYNKLGKVYLEESDYYTALEYFSRSLEITKDLNDRLNRASTLNNLGQVFIALKKYPSAERNIEEALAIAQELNAKAIEANSYFYLSQLYEKTGKFKAALKYNTLYNRMKDSIYNEKRTNKIRKLQEEYRLQKKDAKIALLEKEKEYSQSVLIFTIISAVLIIAVALLLLNRYLVKKKANNQLSRLNKKLDSQNKELAQTNATKDKIFTIIAHDLKNPLSGFRNITSVLVDYYNDMSQEEIKESLTTIRESSNNLMMLLENLLTWAKLQKEEINNDPQKVAINYITKKYIDNFKEDIEKKGVDLDFKINEEVYAYCDSTLISVVIKNLISNAIKYSERGDKIKIDMQNIDSKAYFTITDEGIGIEERKLDKIFEISNSQDSRYGTDGERGTGLGLILSKSFIEMNEGDIWIESTEGEGTTVTFVVPAKH